MASAVMLVSALSCEISTCILRNQDLIISLDTLFLNMFLLSGSTWVNPLCVDCPVKIFKHAVIFSGFKYPDIKGR